jgi:hypothetical protein
MAAASNSITAGGMAGRRASIRRRNDWDLRRKIPARPRSRRPTSPPPWRPSNTCPTCSLPAPPTAPGARYPGEPASFVGVLAGLLLHHAGDPEIDQLDMFGRQAGGADHDVLRLQIAVQNVRPMRGGERAADLPQQVVVRLFAHSVPMSRLPVVSSPAFQFGGSVQFDWSDDIVGCQLVSIREHLKSTKRPARRCVDKGVPL